MRLALKLSAATTVGILLVLAAQTAYQLRELADFQRREIRDDGLIFARTLAAAAGELWASAGRTQALAFIQQMADSKGRTRIQVAEHGGTRDLSEETIAVRHLRSGDEWGVAVTAPVRVADRVVAQLEIHRRLPGDRDYFEAVLRSQIITTGASTLVASLIALLLGLAFVGRPMAELSALAHRVAAGDFGGRSKVRQRDEIGQLAKDLNAMAGRLQAGQAAIKQEQHARTEALEQLRHADRLSTVGKLASSMAHELGTPLNVVSGRATLIAGDEAAPTHVREGAQVVVDQAARMTAILRELMDFARRKPLKLTDTRVGSVVEHAVSLLEPICDKKHVVMTAHGELGASARIDPGKTLQVLTNLMMNAVQAMPEGGALRLDVARTHVPEPQDKHACEGQYVRVSVSDDGVGIPKPRLSEIFQAFFTTKKAGSGTGLGLSVCHGIVREHGGWIDVQSDVGRGSCFRVYLPEGEAV